MSERDSASFRDPSGFVFRRDGVLYRQVNPVYREHYDQLLSSGLYESLASDGLLVAHRETEAAPAEDGEAYRILQPDPVAFISYPYEWCFSALREAALLTLEVQRRALAHGMILKDASAYNVQFRGTAPVFIDTLSFERYEDGQPWVAYRQFCEHFLAPLLLMSRVDPRLGRMQALHVEGIPLDLASRLLPRATWLRLSSLLHIHLHARAIRRYGGIKPEDSRHARSMSRSSLQSLLESLESFVRGIRWVPQGTEWADYEEAHGYGQESLDLKAERVRTAVERTAPARVWDLGANTGAFSRIARDAGASVIAVDADPAAVDRNFRREQNGPGGILPLLVDLAQPSPSLGWATSERMSLAQRGPADMVLALALIHHLAITNNVPLPLIASWISGLGQRAVVEWVPKSDPQAQRLLLSRRDIFDTYSEDGFVEAFSEYFDVETREPIPGTDRVIYSLTRRPGAGSPDARNPGGGAA